MKKFAVSAAFVAVIGCSIGQSVNAGEEIGLTVFSPQAPARAEDVNGNFNSLKTAVESNNTRIGTLETATSGLGAVKATVDANNTRLGTVETLTTGNTAAITGLSSAVDSKIDTVTAQSKIDAVQQSVNSKAALTDITALKTEMAGLLGLVATAARQKSSEYAGVIISNTKINGGTTITPVAPGSAITVALDYAIKDPGCPGCIDWIQVGFSHVANPGQCVYNGIPGASGASGNKQFALTAPAQPGVYFIGFDRAQDFVCSTHWWTGAPNAFGRYIAMIVVQ